MAGKPQRNEPCPCGSGRKYKQCCALKQDKMSRLSWIAIGSVVAAIAAVLFYSFTGDSGSGTRRVWDPAHGHYHNVPAP